MSRTDFHFEFSGEEAYVPEPLVREAESRLQALAQDHTDMIGAAVTVEELSQEETPHFYRARVVAYVRPENVAAVEKQDTVENALRGALEAVERQVHQKRERLGKPWQRKEAVVQVEDVFELTAAEIYDAYAAEVEPTTLLNRGRTDIASQLMVKEGLDEEAAFYAADQMLVAAQELIDSGGTLPPD